MDCDACGAELFKGDQFCNNCGSKAIFQFKPHATKPLPHGRRNTSINVQTKKLYRSDQDKILLGVIGGFGEYFEIDSNVLRVIFALFTLMSAGMAIVAYFVIAVVVPVKSNIATSQHYN